jgi:hypothetical protein
MKDVRGEFGGTNGFVEANVGVRSASRRFGVHQPTEEQASKKHLSAFHGAVSIRERGKVWETRFPGEPRRRLLPWVRRARRYSAPRYIFIWILAMGGGFSLSRRFSFAAESRDIF